LRIVVRVETVGYWDPFEMEEARPPKPEKSENCVICGLELGDGKTYSCPHCGCIGHSDCFDDWLLLRKTCPLCRRAVAAEAI
jgi:uncharacterized paraquat-inducible protein A